MMRITLLVLTVGLLAGCSMSKYSLSMNREHAVPYPVLNVLPEQSEPDVAAND